MAISIAGHISRLLQAIKNCEDSGNTEWRNKHAHRVRAIIRAYLPSGSGRDNGTSIDWTRSQPQRLVFFGDYHHMDEQGIYDHWSNHNIIVRPEFDNLTVQVTGKDHNDIKEYLGDLFYGMLTEQVESETIDALMTQETLIPA